MLDIHQFYRAMAEANLQPAAVVRMAQLHPYYLTRIRNGELPLTEKTANRIRLAIARLKRGESKPEEVAVSGSFRLSVAYVAMFLSLTPEQILAADPARRATADDAWMRAARGRRLAIYITNQYMNVPQAELARAAGMSKAAVNIALREIEDERGEPALEQLLKLVEEAFSS